MAGLDDDGAAFPHRLVQGGMAMPSHYHIDALNLPRKLNVLIEVGVGNPYDDFGPFFSQFSYCPASRLMGVDELRSPGLCDQQGGTLTHEAEDPHVQAAGQLEHSGGPVQAPGGQRMGLRRLCVGGQHQRGVVGVGIPGSQKILRQDIRAVIVFVVADDDCVVSHALHYGEFGRVAL